MRTSITLLLIFLSIFALVTTIVLSIFVTEYKTPIEPWWNNTIKESFYSEPAEEGRWLVLGGSSGVGKALCSVLDDVTFTSGPRSSESCEHKVDITTDQGIDYVCKMIEGSHYNVLVLCTGVHSSSPAKNYNVNLFAPLRILRHIVMNTDVQNRPDKIVVLGSRAARFCSNWIGGVNPNENSYGHSKMLLTSLVQHLAKDDPGRYMVWSPPRLPTNIKATTNHTLSNNTIHTKVLQHAISMRNVILNNNHRHDALLWEYGVPISWRAPSSLVDIQKIYTVNGMHLLGFITNTNFCGNAVVPNIRFPKHREDVIDAVFKRGARIVGSAHSYNSKLFENVPEWYCLVDLEKTLTLTKKHLMCGAGVSINQALLHMEGLGRTFHTTGSHGSQSVVGAAITGTHGHAKQFGTMADTIMAMEISTMDNPQPHWVTDEDTLRELRVMKTSPDKLIVWTVKLNTMNLYIPSTVNTSFTTNISLDELFEADYAKAIPLMKSGIWMTTCISKSQNHGDDDDEQPAQCGESCNVVSIPSEIDMLGYRGYLATSFTRKILKNVISGFIRTVCAHKRGENALIDKLTAKVRHKGSTSEAKQWIAYHCMQEGNILNTEIFIDRCDFDTVHLALSKMKFANLYYYYRFLGASTKSIHALNYQRDVVCIDLHSCSYDILSSVTNIIQTAANDPIMSHIAKI